MNPTDPNTKLFEFIRSITPAGSFEARVDEIDSDQFDHDQIDLDSLQLLQVVNYIEQNFGVRLEDYNVDADDLRSANGLTALLERLRR